MLLPSRRPQHYQAKHYAIEPDASAASYFFAAAAITQGEVTVEGLSRDSLQGDVAFCDCLESMGCQVRMRRTGITVSGGRCTGSTSNMNAISDTVQTLAAVAMFAEGRLRFAASPTSAIRRPTGFMPWRSNCASSARKWRNAQTA